MLPRPEAGRGEGEQVDVILDVHRGAVAGRIHGLELKSNEAKFREAVFIRFVVSDSHFPSVLK